MKDAAEVAIFRPGDTSYWTAWCVCLHGLPVIVWGSVNPNGQSDGDSSYNVSYSNLMVLTVARNILNGEMNTLEVYTVPEVAYCTYPVKTLHVNSYTYLTSYSSSTHWVSELVAAIHYLPTTKRQGLFLHICSNWSQLWSFVAACNSGGVEWLLRCCKLSSGLPVINDGQPLNQQPGTKKNIWAYTLTLFVFFLIWMLASSVVSWEVPGRLVNILLYQ